MATRDLLSGLNAAQVAAVTHIDGPLLVLAGPGSGKTRVVTHRIAYLIEQGVDPKSMVALTFTNKAAEEMRSRVTELVGNAPVWMGTFHGFCVRLLRRYARLVGLPENFSIYDTKDAESVLKAAVQQADFELTHTSLGSLANRISYYKNRLITPEILQAEALSSQEFAVGQVYPFYQRELQRNGAVDFDDILMHVAVLLRSHPELRADWDQRLQHVMVDEYQDTNLAQYVIVRHLSVDVPNLAATGDPDQSIYGWRGANAQNVTNLERDYRDLRIVRLESNYRSTPEILSIADFLIQHNEQRKEKSLLPCRESGSSVRLAVYGSAREEAEDIADQILAAVEHDASYSDFAVLYRTNAQSRLFEHALMRRQIPFQLIGGFRFYLRKEIKDLIAYLLLVNNPDDNVALQRAINSPSRGIGKQTLAKLQQHADRQGVSLLVACRECVDSGILSRRAASAVRSFLKVYDQISSLACGPLVDLLETTIDLTRYRDFLAKQKSDASDDSDVAANLDELLSEAYELDRHCELENAIESERAPLERFLEFAALQADADRMVHGQEQVTLMTLHAAKGLEFPQVYIAAVEENILPHSRSKDDPAALEEERRLLFVGITRAENHLQISYAKRRGFSNHGSGVPSSFLMELPRQEMQWMDKTEAWGGMEHDGFDWGTRGHDEDSHEAWDQSQDRGEWDEACQLDAPYGEMEADSCQIDFEDCQLPPDEMRARIQKLRGSWSKQAVQGRPDEASDFRPGSTVRHERFGIGEIISGQGNGPKRSVTIQFANDGSRRTFRLSHVRLDLVGQTN